MVIFEKDKLVIELSWLGNPVESWLTLMSGLCQLVRNTNSDNIDDSSFFSVIDFLAELQPDFEVAKKMFASQ